VSGVDGAAGNEVGSIQVGAFALSHLGRVRRNNEDSFTICDLTTGGLDLNGFPPNFLLGPQGVLLLVADGMGGEACGEIASRMCVDTLPKRLYEKMRLLSTAELTTVNPPEKEKTVALLLSESVEFANQAIFGKAHNHAAYRGMGTTATAALLVGPNLFVAQVGDSRAYLLRNQELVQLTRDQTFLNFLADLGAEPPRDPERDPRKSILTQAVGTSATLQVRLTHARTCRGDRILLCSDGLHNMVKAPEIVAIVSGEETLPDKCRLLVEAANASGGTDNITVIIAELDGPGLPSAQPGESVEVIKL